MAIRLICSESSIISTVERVTSSRINSPNVLSGYLSINIIANSMFSYKIFKVTTVMFKITDKLNRSLSTGIIIARIIPVGKIFIKESICRSALRSTFLPLNISSPEISPINLSTFFQSTNQAHLLAHLREV